MRSPHSFAFHRHPALMRASSSMYFLTEPVHLIMDASSATSRNSQIDPTVASATNNIKNPPPLRNLENMHIDINHRYKHQQPALTNSSNSKYHGITRWCIVSSPPTPMPLPCVTTHSVRSVTLHTILATQIHCSRIQPCFATLPSCTRSTRPINLAQHTTPPAPSMKRRNVF